MDLEEALNKIDELQAENDWLKSEVDRLIGPQKSKKPVDKDRRKYRRSQVSFLMSYRIFNENSFQNTYAWKETRVRDISLGGMLFFSETEYPTGTLIEVKIRLPSSYGEIICCSAVRRCEASEEGFNIAVEFADISGYYKTLIEDALVRQQERRRSRRYRMGYPFLFTAPPSAGKDRGYIKNISRHGIGFLTSTNLQIGQKINAELFIADQIYKVSGTVAQCKDSEIYNMYDIGADLGDLADEFKETLEQTLREMYQKKKNQ